MNLFLEFKLIIFPMKASLVRSRGTAEWFPKRERALSTSIFNSGCNVAGIIAPAIIPPIALAFGWRGAYVAVGLAGFIWLIFWLIFYGLPEQNKRVSQAELDHILSDRDAGEQERARGGKAGWEAGSATLGQPGG